MLSRIAQEFAAEIAGHDWSDAPWRLDRAGHRREVDSNRGVPVLAPEEADRVRTNVMWVVAQVLRHSDPNLDLHEFAQACGIPSRITHNANGRPSGTIPAGIRVDHETGCPYPPGEPR